MRRIVPKIRSFGGKVQLFETLEGGIPVKDASAANR
jgi:hypothetical protein